MALVCVWTAAAVASAQSGSAVDAGGAASPEPWWVTNRGIVAATVLGPVVAVLLTFAGQAVSVWWRRRRRSDRVRALVRHEVDANLALADAVREDVGEAGPKAGDRVTAAARLVASGAPTWERAAYTALLAELPDAVATAEVMRDLAAHYALLRRMDQAQARLLAGEAGASVGSDDWRLRAWERYADARGRLADLGNPLGDSPNE